MNIYCVITKFLSFALAQLSGMSFLPALASLFRFYLACSGLPSLASDAVADAGSRPQLARELISLQHELSVGGKLAWHIN
ncbi:hypothetical protein PoB_001031000 [Plakobranchus ocellatus]|uniref:Secreted protein n=1 Tax=Plakobranchus ocellatus TaxID=259542 RepID=A0AAV3YM60_9GAST|nr:hypothetical protein PoB_001031000 [Plakobranchus ocellatus]